MNTETSAAVSQYTQAFSDYQSAAWALLAEGLLSEREGQFCGGLVFRRTAISEKQGAWLDILLRRNGLPPVAAR